jgi:hypothetical protein
MMTATMMSTGIIRINRRRIYPVIGGLRYVRRVCIPPVPTP